MVTSEKLTDGQRLVEAIRAAVKVQIDQQTINLGRSDDNWVTVAQLLDEIFAANHNDAVDAAISVMDGDNK